MKLSHVLLLIIFSSILFVGMVSDISFAKSKIDRDGPYEAYAHGYRFGGDQDRLHVYLYARASSTDRARNGRLSITFVVNNVPEIIPKSTPVNRHYWHKDSRTFQFEVNACDVNADADGYSTDGIIFYGAYAHVPVKAMPPPEPTPRRDPQVGISATDSDDTASPGETHTYKLVTSEPYYCVSWYVKAPWDTTARGTYISGESGDGTKTESTFSYTFPSGTMHTGDFLITAVIARWSDMSQYEETYTETVSLE